LYINRGPIADTLYKIIQCSPQTTPLLLRLFKKKRNLTRRVGGVLAGGKGRFWMPISIYTILKNNSSDSIGFQRVMNSIK